MKQERKAYIYEGRTIYEWDQSLDTVFCFIRLPPIPEGVRPSSVLSVIITASSISVGFKGTKPYLSHQLAGIADAQQSLWLIQEVKDEQGKQTKEKQMVIELQKAQKGVRWGCIFKGHGNLNAFQQQNLKKKMMLERFQEQNPGFDFSGAQFNGQIPEARTFMGGVKYL